MGTSEGCDAEAVRIGVPEQAGSACGLKEVGQRRRHARRQDRAAAGGETDSQKKPAA